MKRKLRRPRPGFALVIALSLMAFIFLLLYGLGAMLRLECHESGVRTEQLQARANALLALDVALGNLQRLAGPDQRATASADILAADGYTGAEAAAVAKHWTGVWDATQPAGSASFLGWLVSDPSAGAPAAEDDAINPPARRVRLVGAGTLGAAMTDDFVEVPVVPILDPDTGDETGEFGYWVGDEGVKARFQGTLPSDETPTAARAQADFRLNQRNAVETRGDLRTVNIGDLLNPSASNQPRSQSWGDVFLSDSANTGILRESYFDFTPYHLGLLTDARHGGWKKDLTWLFEENDADVAAALADIDAVDAVTGSQITAAWPEDRTRVNWMPAPTWELLRSYYRFSRESEPLAMRRQDAEQHGVVPVITHFILNFMPGLSGIISEAETPGDLTDDYFEGRLRVYLDVQLVLWNPYDTAIDLPESDLEVVWPNEYNGLPPDMRMTFGSLATAHRGTMVKDFVGPGGKGFFTYQDRFNVATNGYGLSFRVPHTVMQPGETLIFTISDLDDNAGYTGENLLENRSSVGPPNAVWLELPDLITQASTPLNGQQVMENVTFEQTGSLIDSKALLRHVALKRLGTAGYDTVEHFSDYYTRAMQQSIGDKDLPLRRAANMPPLTDEVLGGVRGMAGAGPAVNSNYTLRFKEYMHHSNTLYFRHSRWAYNYNPRAAATVRSEVDLYNNPNYEGTWQQTPPAVLQNTTTNAAGQTRVAERPYYTGAYANQYQLCLYSLPREGFKPYSIGDLQHVNAYPVGVSNNYLIANSLVDLRLPDTAATVRTPTGTNANRYPPIVDGSYLLNEALWDGYYFSTIDGSLSQQDLDDGQSFPNSRIRLSSGTGLDDFMAAEDWFDKGASRLVLEGAFNINSTSVEAWKAVLASSNGLDYSPQDDAVSNGSPLGISFSRLLQPAGTPAQPWRGYREISENELQVLAEEIVNEVRRRGPFLTLSDFVNRQLGAPAEGAGLQGALAQAIDNAGINTNSALGLPPDTTTAADLVSTAKDWYIEQALIGSRSAGETRWLMQGDILQRIGGMISARSDTFIIRAYGETASPLTGKSATAYLEALVQRTPRAVTPQGNALDEPADAFGRRFEIVGFRWLNEEEL